MALVNVQRALKTERVFGRPYRVKVEPTNICNTECQLCPTGLGFKGRQKGIMELDRFKCLIDKISRYVYYLDLSMWGDPLIVPNIYKMIYYAHRKGMNTYLGSNLHAFRPEEGHADELVLSGLDLITCSLHGASQATYEEYQPGKRLDIVIEKIKAINEAKKRHGRTTPSVILNCVVFKCNQNERLAFEQLATSLYCLANFSTASLNLRFVGKDKDLAPLAMTEREKDDIIQELKDKWLPDDPEFVRAPYKRELNDAMPANGYNGNKLLDCSWPWTGAVFNWDGSVVMCCGVFESGDDLGNVFDTDFSKIWNSRRYRMARRSFKHRIGHDEGSPCRECSGTLE
jgi:radical SAM protein with 4Fe4S-binding SPASM domain